MTTFGYCQSRLDIDEHGITEPGDVYWNLPPAELYEHALRAGEGSLAANGALVCTTGRRTGRSPHDRFIVDEPATRDDIHWGAVNKPISEADFNALHQRVIAHYRGRRLFVRDALAGAEEATRIPIRVITETAWHNLFSAQLFISPLPGATRNHVPNFTVLSAPSCFIPAQMHGTQSEAFVALHLTKGLILIGGTSYAGEIKKSIFSVMNYLLPKAGVLSMHCSANVGSDGDVALFFGLSGTGKTTLSADPTRRLVGDDEHGWSDRGVFNIEGGCYAKCIKLSHEYEPQIYEAIRFGSVLENVVMDHTRHIDYDSSAITENTRAAYPLGYINDAVIPGVAGHPKNVVFLTCDAFGVLPPIAMLTPAQAMYHFLLGYTAKVAGTEAGVTEPEAAFSTCFAAPFLPLSPETYASMLGERLAKHNAQCWLVNTGWSGGGVGVGQRMNLKHTRAIVRAALVGDLDGASCATDPVFGLQVPTRCPDVPGEVLDPRRTWQDKGAYDAKANELAGLFARSFQRFDNVSQEVAQAGPRL
ncbi:MAG: phosphoenolpyruvate carboxykinase (ATP) [Phycisphaerae bacterium]